MNFAAVTEIYANAGICDVASVDYSWPEVGKIYSSIRTFSRDNPNEADFDAEGIVASWIWNWLGTISSIPIDPKSSLFNWDVLNREIEAITSAENLSAVQLTAIAKLVSNVNGPNPMLQRLESLRVKLKDLHVAFHLKCPYPVATDWAESLFQRRMPMEGWTAVGRRALKESGTFDALVHAGSPRSLPEFASDSGRTKKIHWLRLQEAFGTWKHRDGLATLQTGKRRPSIIFATPMQISSTPLEPSDGVIVDQDDRPLRTVRSATEEDSVIAVTEDGETLYFHPDEEVFIIDPDAIDETVRKTRSAFLHPNIFVIFRRRGDSNIIAAVADSIMGSAGAALRGTQSFWKDGLRTLVSATNYTTVASQLEAMGCTRARANLRGWMSPSRSRIGVRDFSVFEAILQLLGTAAAAQQSWTELATLRHWHHKAGNKIKATLTASLQQMDINLLDRRGSWEFEVEEFPGESLAAVRLIQVIVPTAASMEENGDEPDDDYEEANAVEVGNG